MVGKSVRSWPTFHLVRLLFLSFIVSKIPQSSNSVEKYARLTLRLLSWEIFSRVIYCRLIAKRNFLTCVLKEFMADNYVRVIFIDVILAFLEVPRMHLAR